MTSTPRKRPAPGVGAWIRYGDPLTPDQVEFAATHYRAAILQPWETEAASLLKRRRPDMTVLAYKCLSSARDYEPGPVYSSGVSYAEAEAHGWFARRLDGSRIEWNTYPRHWQLTPWEQSYRARWVDNVVSEFSDSPFDGVMADNDVFDDYYGLNLPLQGVDSLAGLRQALGELISEAGEGLNAAGKILVPNIAESRRESGRWQAHAAYGGGFDEMWLGWAPQALFDPITATAQLSQAAGPGLSILRVPTDGDDTHPNFRYGLAAFWIFGGGHGAYAATGHDDYSLTQHIPELDWDLGPATGDPRCHRHVWTRQFEFGWAAVNLNLAGRRVRRLRVPAGMVLADDSPAPSHLQLPPHQGILLRRA